ncbi:MAG TPA: TadE/TadG family type IV pilus assembly protein [Verrucomicrobiae bacterium]|nr:TadE/TadG family type IV pilus assembly protein [Verrucomicrobiae bacterium]
MKSRRNGRKCLLDRSGQALVEFTFVAAMLLLLIFGLIDFCRAISVREVITNLSREGSNLASRNTSLTNALAAIVASADPLNITNNGRIYISEVMLNAKGQPWITNQVTWGGISTNGAASKVGLPDSAANTGWIPTTTPSLPQPNQAIYVTEIYYSFQAATPVGKFLSFALPTRLYDAAYF